MLNVQPAPYIYTSHGHYKSINMLLKLQEIN